MCGSNPASGADFAAPLEIRRLLVDAGTGHAGKIVAKPEALDAAEAAWLQSESMIGLREAAARGIAHD